MKQCLCSSLIQNTPVNGEVFRLELSWRGSVIRAGQFVMVKPKRSGVFLPRPLSVAFWQDNSVGFLVQRKGRGTEELASLHPGEEVELTGPLGNAWTDFLPAVSARKDRGLKPIALIGGGVGIAPLLALGSELPKGSYDFYAGFRNGFCSNEEKNLLLEPVFPGIALSGAVLSGPGQLIIAAEETAEECSGFNAGVRTGRIPDFLDTANYAAVCACGPEAMLRTVAEKCAAAGVPCYVSLERRMACGAGACLGCTVTTAKGNRRCCADGPVFPGTEVFL